MSTTTTTLNAGAAEDRNELGTASALAVPREPAATMFKPRTSQTVRTLTWSNITLDRPAGSATVENGNRPILKDVSCAVESGNLLGILGPSGCGKTSLLEVLADQRNKTSGEIRVNGSLVRSGDWRSLKIASFVEQSDAVMGSLTVRENLEFYAGLKMANLSGEERTQRVETLMEELGLTECADVLSGSMFFKAISGGQKRRLSLAIGLLTDPDILFLDEVTSGLDSATALQIVQLLRRLADAGRIIVCTIHQPRSAIFAEFDKILLLSGGETVYFGEREGAVAYFRDRIGAEVGKDDNAADFYADVLTQYGVEEEERQRRLRRIKDAYASSAEQQRVQQHVTSNVNATPAREALRRSAAAATNKQQLQAQAMIAAGWFMQFWLILRRTFTNLVRNPVELITRVAQAGGTALLYGLTYLNLGFDQSAISSRVGFMAFLSINIAFIAASGVAISFIEEKVLIRRERANNMYSLSAYFFAAIAGDLPAQLILPVVQLCFLYWMVPLYETAQQFWIAVAILFMLFQVSSAIGYLISVVAPNFTVAITILPLLVVMNLLFSGMPIIKSSMPVFLRWVTNISFLRHAFAALMSNEFSQYDHFSCSEIEKQTGRCIYESGADVLADFEISAGVGVSIGIMVVLYVVYRGLSYLALMYQERKARQMA